MGDGIGKHFYFLSTFLDFLFRFFSLLRHHIECCGHFADFITGFDENFFIQISPAEFFRTLFQDADRAENIPRSNERHPSYDEDG